jgi:hypothetical protein
MNKLFEAQQTEEAERARGAHIVRMRGEPADVMIASDEGARLFTHKLAGCVGIGRIAILNDGRRLAYMQHAAYGDVCDGVVQVRPFTPAGMVESRGVIMPLAYEPLGSFKASRADIPYAVMNSQESLRPIIEAMVEACMTPEAVTIVPYYEGSAPDDADARSLVIDVSPSEKGIILAEGQPIR